MQRNLQQMPGVTFRGGVPAHYPDPENSGHYMNVFKTATTLNDGQQQPVDNFAPRANLKCFLKTVQFHLAFHSYKSYAFLFLELLLFGG
jgi:hypothetical protein